MSTMPEKVVVTAEDQANPQQWDDAIDDRVEFIEFKGELPNMRKIEPVTLEYKNITLRVPGKKDGKPVTRVVLDDVRGCVAAGTFTAIMGPSGGGKTSLLNVLAGRVARQKGLELTGQLLIKDKPRDESTFKGQAAYVMQDDILFAFMTVREVFMVATHFQLGWTISRAQKEEYVSSIISVLGLTKAQNTIIGNAKVRGVSGGERKRVNIGVELIADPAILFMDEPTSGLDSFQALSVMSAIKNLTRNNRTVVASIHQPRSSIYSLFDMLHLLSEGRTVYFGPAHEATAYLSTQGFSCPPSFNAADFLLDLVSLDLRSPDLEESSRGRLSKLHAAWRSRRAAVVQRVVSSVPEADPLTPKTQAARQPWTAPRPHKYRISWVTQFGLLLWRQLSLVFRNKMAIVIRLAMALMFALVLGAIYSNRSGDSQKAIQDSIGFLFGCVLNQTFGAMVGILNTFGDEKYIVQRERASKSYRLSAYFVAKVLSEVPVNMLACSVFSAVIYWVSNLQHSPQRFFVFWAVLLEDTFCAMGLGLMLACAAPSADAANALAPLFNVSMMLLSGFYINVNSLPDGAKWCPNASFIRWMFGALVHNEFEGRTYDCTGVVGGCISHGETVIANLSFDGFSLREGVGYGFVIAAVLYTLAYIFLRLASPTYTPIAPPPSKSLDGGAGEDAAASPTETLA